MGILLEASNVFGSVNSDFIIALISSATTVITGYIILRERLLKTEVKLENVYDYIDNRNQVIENKIKELKDDISEFKDINKETAKSLAENTAAIKELKIVLNIVTEKLTK
jgi:cell division protein FtsB